jgi:hypothetical protein
MTTTQEPKTYDNRADHDKVHAICRRRGITGYTLADWHDEEPGKYRFVETAVVVAGVVIALAHTTRKGRVRLVDYRQGVSSSVGIG